MREGCVDEIVSLPDLVSALGHYERFGALIALSAAQLNSSGAYSADGALTMQAWLRQHTRMSGRDTRRMPGDGKFLHDFDAVAEAAVSGVLSASQVTALKAVITDPTRELFAEHQQGVIDAIAPLNARDSETVCQQWRANAEAVVEMPEPKTRERSWSTSELPDGSVLGRFVFDKIAAELLETALETARTFDGAGDERSTSVRNADAIVDVLSFFNGNNLSDGTPRHHPHVELCLEPTSPSDIPTGDPGAAVDPLVGGCAVTANGRMHPRHTGEQTTIVHPCTE